MYAMSLQSLHGGEQPHLNMNPKHVEWGSLLFAAVQVQDNQKRRNEFDALARKLGRSFPNKRRAKTRKASVQVLAYSVNRTLWYQNGLFILFVVEVLFEY